MEGAPPEVSGVFTEPLDREASRLVLFGEAGERLAEGGVDEDDETATTMRLQPPTLGPGLYEVRWTARTPDDGFVERGRWSYTVGAVAQTPSPIPSEGLGPSAPGTSATPTTPMTDPSPSLIASAPASPAASPIVPDGSDADPLGEAAVPLLALGAVAAAAVLYLARRPR